MMQNDVSKPLKFATNLLLPSRKPLILFNDL